MLRTLNQNNQLYSLLSRLGIDKETKNEMVLTYTHGRTCASSEMTTGECQAMINDLRRQKTDPSDKMRKKIISLFIKQGYTLPGGRADMNAIEVWCKKYGYLKKGLNEYKYNELPKLVSQAEQMYYSFIKNI